MQRTLAGLVLAFWVARAEARSLDSGRPGSIEDAYPLARFATEFSARISAGPGSRRFLVQEIGHGVARGVEVSVSGHFALTSANGYPSGLSGIPISLLVNFTTERTSLPGLAAHLEAWIPEGSAAGRGVGATLRGLATRSFGRQRLHVNGALTVTRPAELGQREIPLWAAGVAVDRTLIRSSTLLVGEIAVSRDARGVPVRAGFGLGVRRQLSPVLVFDTGALLEHQDGRHHLGFGLGLSYLLGDGLFLLGRSR